MDRKDVEVMTCCCKGNEDGNVKHKQRDEQMCIRDSHMTRGQLGDAVEADGVDKRSFYVEQQNRIADFANKVHALSLIHILWPMEGNVILDYSMDSTVYFATLDQYKYNPAVIIAGDVNSKVYALSLIHILRGLAGSRRGKPRHVQNRFWSSFIRKRRVR